MKTIINALLATSLLTSCGLGSQKTSGQGSALQSRNAPSIGIPETTHYIASVKVKDDVAADTNACAEEIRKLGGVEVDNVFSNIGSIAFSTIPELSTEVAKLPCVEAVELDGQVVVLDPETPSRLIATINVGDDLAGDTRRCADKLAAISGITEVSALESIGVVTFSATTDARTKAQELSCVAVIEDDQPVGIEAGRS